MRVLPKVMLNYRPNGRGRVGRPLKRLLDEAKTGLLRPNSWRMMIMMIIYFLGKKPVWKFTIIEK